jgi:hypothetical protein
MGIRLLEFNDLPVSLKFSRNIGTGLHEGMHPSPEDETLNHDHGDRNLYFFSTRKDINRNPALEPARLSPTLVRRMGTGKRNV